MKKCDKSRKLGSTLTLPIYIKAHTFILLKCVHKHITTTFQSGSMTRMTVLGGVKELNDYQGTYYVTIRDISMLLFYLFD